MNKKFNILLAILMIISMLPITTVPADAASGDNVIVSVPWEKINNCGHQQYSGPCQAYCWAYCRIILDNTPHTYLDYWTGSQAVAPAAAGYVSQSAKMKTKQILLETVCNSIDLGRPAVLGVNGTPGSAHFVVAIGYKANCNRNQLSESDILILDPANSRITSANGANETYISLSSYTLTFLTATNNYVCWTTPSGGAGTTTSVTGSNSAEPEYFDCFVQIQCFAGQTVNLYNNPGDNSRVDYFDKGQGARSVYGAKLSDGSTWYRVNVYSLALNRGVDLWLKYESNKMTVTYLSKSYTVYLNANGGYVSTGYKNVTDGEAFGSLPTPTRDGYIFDGWYTSASGGTQITTATTVDSSYDESTLYAHWSAAKQQEDISKKDTISGRWSDTAGWTLSKGDGTLTVSGTGSFSLGDMSEEARPLVKQIVVNDGITILESSAFSKLSNVVSVQLPQSLETVEAGAFVELSSLKEITLPRNVSSVSSIAFQQCYALENIYIDNQNAWYRSVDGILFSKDMKTLQCFPHARSGDYEIPDCVTTLPFGSFMDCGQLSSVTIPKSVTSIDSTSFHGFGISPFSGVIRVYSGSNGETFVKKMEVSSNLKYEIIDKCTNGHTWDNGKVTTEATATTSGVRTYTCTVCNATRTEAIPALNVSASGSLQNFSSDKEYYYTGLFRDVAVGAWYADNVAAVYQLGLMKGTAVNTFEPGKNITIAETITLAARIHSIYYTGKESFDTYDGGNWYDPYVNYARDNGIISENYNFDLPASREIFAHILAKALPESALTSIRNESIQFVDAGNIVYAGDIELLCKAGIINGVQDNGVAKFLPKNTITRAEGAAIVTRMAKPALRK